MSDVVAWEWPNIGPTPINEGLDSEIFDTRTMPHVHTFVREAVQNSLDARRDPAAPVRVRFSFHQGNLSGRAEFLHDLRDKKALCKRPWPEDWQDGRISWLVIEDFNTKGLSGDLLKRSGDFWNYWLNFGISNKTGAGRGGRGIGRVTFLIASQINAVIGVTRRSEDNLVAACGMSVMKMFEDGDEYRSSYAYLARGQLKNTFELYDSPAFISGLISGFRMADRTRPDNYGYSLAIPFPWAEIKADNIKAAVIEHFAPAIIDGDLVVEVDGAKIDPGTIDTIAHKVSTSFQAEAFRQDAVRVLDLERRALDTPDMTIQVKDTAAFANNLSAEDQTRLREIFETRHGVVLELAVPVVRHGNKSVGPLRAALGRTPRNKAPVDLFFRDGMCLPSVGSRRPGEIDLVVQTRGEGDLVSYLNFCEGKAHLDLTENHEVTAKLTEQGFSELYTVKRFVKRLMEELRTAVLPDASQPDSSIFSRYFAAPRNPSPSGERKVKPKRRRNVVIVDPPPPRTPIFLLQQLEDGFRIKANPQFQEWPVSARIAIAYADGTRRPKWSRFDFELRKLGLRCTGGSEPVLKDNVISVSHCRSNFELEICGFDPTRELVANIDPRRIVGAAAAEVVHA